MPEDLKGLIEKINQEGVQAAEGRAKEIESEAKRRAEDIIAKAEKKAKNVVSGAEEEAARMEKSGEASLRQSGRDFLLSVRKELNAMLGKLIASRLGEALTPGEMAGMIASLAKDYKGKGDITVSLKKEDLEKMEKIFLGELKQAAEKGITLKPSDDIRGGFLVSYDGGKSHYDFTDKALAEYIGAHLKPKLAEILKDAASVDKRS